jgi:hypothetical protein
MTQVNMSTNEDWTGGNDFCSVFVVSELPASVNEASEQRIGVVTCSEDVTRITMVMDGERPTLACMSMELIYTCLPYELSD